MAGRDQGLDGGENQDGCFRPGVRGAGPAILELRKISSRATATAADEDMFTARQPDSIPKFGEGHPGRL